MIRMFIQYAIMYGKMQENGDYYESAGGMD